MAAETHAGVTPPIELITRSDVMQTLREIQALDEYLTEQKIRKVKAALPRLSPVVESLARQNKLDLLDEGHRRLAKDLMQYMKAYAPVVHLSFATEPTAASLQKLLMWFRREASPFCVLVIGIVPSLGGGCLLRTSSKVFDFGLRQHLLKHSDVLLTSLKRAMI